MVDIEKFICSLIHRSSGFCGIKVIDIIDALHYQGLYYKDGKIVPIEDKNELKESEDDRVRKELFKHLKEGADGYEPAGNSEDYKRWLGWLEKQGGQNPDWSEEDDMMLNSFLHKVEVCDLLTNKENVWIVKKLKALKDRVGCEANCTTMWKPSGEQMKYLHKYAEQNNYDGAILTGLYDDLLKIYNLNNHDKN